MAKLQIPIVLGTARKGQQSQKAFDFLCEHLDDSEDTDFELVEVADYLIERTHEAWNEHPDTPAIGEWRKIAENADGFIIMLPEYNHGYPGELKLLLDAAYAEYEDKPVMLVGTSGGAFGGARVVEHIKPVLTAMGMRPMGTDLHIGNLGDIFSEDGEITNEARKKYVKRIDEGVAELLEYARKLGKQ